MIGWTCLNLLELFHKTSTNFGCCLSVIIKKKNKITFFNGLVCIPGEKEFASLAYCYNRSVKCGCKIVYNRFLRGDTF